MNNIQEKIENSYLFGFIKREGKYSFYLMPIAYWILNYTLYDPTYNPDDWDDEPFRNNVLNVLDEDIDNYMEAIDVDKIELNELNDNLLEVLCFFIDFDSKLFITYFDDVDVEEYLPCVGWVGKFEDPLNYLPDELRTSTSW